MAKYTVLFQGDSITDCGRGNCGGAGFDNKGLGPGYPGMISARLLCDRPEIEWNFINKGISGNRIVDLYARWKIDALNLKPDVISIMIGVNDTWHEIGNHNGVEIDRYERIYRELLTWTRMVLPKVKFVLLEPYICTNVFDYKAFQKEIPVRRKIVAKLAKEFDAVLIKSQELFDDACKLAPASHWTPDGVHPTPAGHQLITDAWLKQTASLFK